jgi:hypothetical protein
MSPPSDLPPMAEVAKGGDGPDRHDAVYLPVSCLTIAQFAEMIQWRRAEYTFQQGEHLVSTH